jgi:predicted HicB family RNase H-like nuclease
MSDGFVPIGEINEDVSNIKAAMDKVAETLKPTRRTIVKETDAPAGAQQLIRCTDEEKENWKQCAALAGISVSEWIRNLLNNEANKKLVCQHPADQRKSYPWSEKCMACGERLR